MFEYYSIEILLTSLSSILYELFIWKLLRSSANVVIFFIFGQMLSCIFWIYLVSCIYIFPYNLFCVSHIFKSCILYYKACILNLVFCILYLIPCILHHISCILYLVPCILHPISRILYLVPCIIHHVSYIMYLVSFRSVL